MKILTKYFAFLLLLTLTSGIVHGQACQPGDPGYISIDFDTDGQGNVLPRGAVIDETTYANFGVHFSSQVSSTGNPTGNYPLIIFDSSAPTGGDCDLGTPSYHCDSNTNDPTNDCQGLFPGRSETGLGGANNCESLGNIVIISENYPYDEIGLADPNPDDLGAGGSMIIDFDNPLTVIDMQIVDDASGIFHFTKSDLSLQSIPYDVGEDNDVSSYNFDISDVISIEIVFYSSGSISAISFCDMQTQQAALPVEFESIVVNESREGAEIEWVTAMEYNADYFQIEKSTDGKNFKSIGDVLAAGNSTERLTYSFVDRNATGLSYYRIKQVDFDSEFSLSKVVNIQLVNDIEVSVYPNPTMDYLQIGIAGEMGAFNADLIDLSTGSSVRTINNLKRETTIDMQNLVSGMYVLRILDGSGAVVNLQRIIKFE